jgi:hypothetical protein
MKDGFYHDQFPVDMFFPLVIEVFGFLHQQVNGFFHRCANMAWGVTGNKGPPLSILCALYRQKVLVALQCAWSISILKGV